MQGNTSRAFLTAIPIRQLQEDFKKGIIRWPLHPLSSSGHVIIIILVMETFANDDESMSALLEPKLDAQPWSKEEDKEFESLIAKISLEEDQPNRFELISNHFPGRTTDELEKRYQELVADVNAIEAGQVPFPEYNDRDSWESVVEEDEVPEPSKKGAKNVVRQKRNPECKWSEDEHKLFLEGLEKLGSGNWKGISRHYVVTKTPSQVASHGQKYRMRKTAQESTSTTTSTRKKRKSIHDISLDQDGSRSQ